MTEKRFVPIFDGFNKRVVGAKDNGVIISFMDMFDLLNKLNDKCEFLEIENESLEDGATRYAELYHQSLKENEQLKQQIEELEFKLRTIEAYDRTAKEEYSDTVYDFKKKLKKW